MNDEQESKSYSKSIHRNLAKTRGVKRHGEYAEHFMGVPTKPKAKSNSAAIKNKKEKKGYKYPGGDKERHTLLKSDLYGENK